jgi:chemotaxis protein CheD
MKMRQSRAWQRLPEEQAPLGTALYYFDRHVNGTAAKVLPGEYLVTSRDIALVTLLGSCVSACIRDPEQRVGGMNHFMLPDSAANGPVSESARYGSYAMEKLVNEILKAGGVRRRLEAKVFGGGAVLKGFTQRPVGERNAEFVRGYLRREGIPIVAEDLLDVHPRKVYFFPATGKVLVRSLAHTPADVLRLDKLYRERLQQGAAVEGSVELFLS